ncbi:Hydroxyneurosporene synthase [Lentinula edodes]|uniref:Hydroxyneurosporene synthase n=1 Tax=Lentinula edodes TaxID=5353 RepID=A0A1Q3DX17_LENED|nr:Hydroxyneurosporene synthase [Lentinula edodes]
MMFASKKIAHSLLIASVLSNFAHAVSFDGQYIQPNLTNTAVEWWWGSAVGASQSPGTPGPVLQFLFYQGYSILADFNHSSLPEYYITINGFFSNGNNFSLTVPATSGNISEGNNNSVTGTWGTVGAFQISSDLKTMAVTFNAPDAPYRISGSMNFTSNRANHYGCNVTDSPYFDVVKPVKTLNDAEQVLFNQLGWAVAIPGGTVNVDVRINGTRLQFTGNGYHDQNWMPLALNEFISSWYFGFAEDTSPPTMLCCKINALSTGRRPRISALFALPARWLVQKARLRLPAGR